MTESSMDHQFPEHPSKPNPALKRLEKLVGTWDMTGRTLDSQVDNISGRNTFEWITGGFFLKSSGEINFKGFIVQAVEIIAYDEASDTFRSHVYSNLSGTVETYHWNVVGDQVTHWAEGSRYSGTLSQDGNTLSGGWRPVEGQPSSGGAAYDAVMTRVK